MSDYNVEPTISLVPGKECPTCSRRMPYPRKETSPDTRMISFRVPLDIADEFEEDLEIAAKHIGAHDQPHWRYNTILWGLQFTLQSKGIKEYEGIGG